MREVASALLLTWALSACSTLRPPLTAPSLAEGGALFVYLLPFPREAARLTFSFDEISALREDGLALPLPLRFKETRGEEMTRERRLAAGELPEGRYTGLSFRVGSASLRTEEGKADLVSPRDMVILQAPFTLAKRQAVVLTLEFDYKGSIVSGFRFTPVFTAQPPPRPAPGLIALASSRASSTVVLFDKITARIAGIVPTGAKPSGVALDPDKQRAYVAASGDDTVESIGLLEQAVLNRLTLRGGDQPLELALTPNGRTLLSANEGSGTVSVIDAIPLVESARITVGNKPTSLALDRAGTRAFVFNSGSSSVTVLDIPSRTVVTTIATEPGPFRGQFNRNGDKLYVIHRTSPYLTIIDPASLSVASRVYVGPGGDSLKVDSLADRIYLARRGTGTIEIYDPLSLLSVDSIPAGGDVSFMAIDGEGNNLYLASPGRGEVRVLRIVGKEITARVEVGEDPYGVVLVGER